MPAITAEHLVATIALQNHGRVAADLPAQEKQRDVGGIAKGRVVAAHQAFYHIADACAADLHFVVLGAELFRYAPCGRFVAALINIETGGECFQPTFVMFASECRDRGGVNATAQEHAHRDVARQVASHRLSDQSAHGLHGRLEVVFDRGRIGNRRIRLAAHAVFVYGQGMTRQQLANAVEGRALAQRGAVVQELVQTAEIGLRADLAGGQNGLDLRSEGDPALGAANIQRLDAESVAHQVQPPLAAIPKREREHALETGERVHAPLQIRAQHHLGVGMPAEMVAGTSKGRAQTAKVEHFAVVRQRHLAVVGKHRLPTERG